MEQTISEIVPSSSSISHLSKENETKKRPNVSDVESHPGDISLSESMCLGENESFQTDVSSRKKRHNCNSSDDTNCVTHGISSQSAVNDIYMADGSTSAPRENLQSCQLIEVLMSSTDASLVSGSAVNINGTSTELDIPKDGHPINIAKESLCGENVSRVNNVIDEVPSQTTTFMDQSKVCSENRNVKAVAQSRRKLLILDVNGLLADIVSNPAPQYMPDAWLSMKAVFKRPLCDDFLQFCFDNFDVGIWSSRNRKNVDNVVDFLMGEKKNKLLFCWDQSHCTNTGHMTVEDRQKPLFLKEIKKLWDKVDPNLPWEKGYYNEFNTLLMDDSPHKALRNPPYTGIFPYPYEYHDIKDNLLGRSGKLRLYLEKLLKAENVQEFVKENPFGQRAITKANLSWAFYSKIFDATSSSKPENKGDDKSSEPKNEAKQEAPSEASKVIDSVAIGDLTETLKSPSEASELISVAIAEDLTQTLEAPSEASEVITSAPIAENHTRTMEPPSKASEGNI